MQRYVPLVARVFLTVIFFKSAFDKITGFADTQQFMATKGGIPQALTGLLLVGAIVAELGGGLSVLLGYKARWGALALVAFLIPTTLIFHSDLGDRMQLIQFMKNLAIMGGLLMVYSFGAGPISLDERSTSKNYD